MHILIIKAHPRADGFSHRIAEKYKMKQKSLGNTVELLELTDKENFQEYATFVDATQADELVWIFPVWWMDAPAVMKNFWDRNFT